MKKAIEALFDPTAGLQIHCNVYRMSSARGSTHCPRYWIVQGKTIIWDYPKDFLPLNQTEHAGQYPYVNDVSEISALLRHYIDTPKAALMTTSFDDRWGLIDMLRCADRRLGLKRLEETYTETDIPAIQAILTARSKANVIEG
ncbi:hypothetical protein VV869_14755 [Photobacterium sp. MCCC 1A19761]|uniref:hypothetical protein n=1 Tax=Photobacterium sp. MCCC 1A19761 TaxID=3115000 RepID=UPI00307F8D81